VRFGLGCVYVAAEIGFALMWATRVPTKTQSMVWIFVNQSLAGLMALIQTDPVPGVIGSVAFASLSAYIVFFHRPSLMLVNFLVTLAITVTLTIRIALAGNPSLAVSAFVVILEASILFPLVTQIAVHNLGADASNADTDPLTGLLNRRGLTAKTRELLAGRRTTDADAQLVVITIDLDRFKALNDTLGHDQGDRALMAVASTLRANTRETAIVARIGGEEFVIVDRIAAQQSATVAQRLCSAIAALPYPITASIGTAAHGMRDLDSDAQSTIDELIKIADHAMYTAKRAGGNQIRCATTGACLD
jgi:diguanylate cyclase